LWIYTKDFFASAVKYENGINVRFRSKAHVDRFVNMFGGKILKLAGTDYRYRIFMNKDIFATVMLKVALDIDYTNFKDAVWQKYHNEEEHLAMYGCWSALAQYQERVK